MMLMFDRAIYIYIYAAWERCIKDIFRENRRKVSEIHRAIYLHTRSCESSCLLVVEGKQRKTDRDREREEEREGEREGGRLRSLIVRGNFSHRQRDCRRPRRFSAFPSRFSCFPIFALSVYLPLSLPLGIAHRTKKGAKVSFSILIAPPSLSPIDRARVELRPSGRKKRR